MVSAKREPKTATFPSGPVSVWTLLESAINDIPGPRPENSVTPAEFAARSGLSEVYCRALLDRNRELRKVAYLTENRKRAVCYVPA